MEGSSLQQSQWKLYTSFVDTINQTEMTHFRETPALVTEEKIQNLYLNTMHRPHLEMFETSKSFLAFTCTVVL